MSNVQTLKIKTLIRSGILVLGMTFISSVQLMAQCLVDGYVFEAKNQGYLNQVKVLVFELPENIVRGEMETGPDGHFVFNLPAGRYRVMAYKDMFIEKNDTITLGKEKVFLKMEMQRRPEHLVDTASTKVIIENEAVERKNKDKPSRPKRLGEANITVPLPKLEPSSDGFTERGESSAAPAPAQISDPKTARPVPINGSETEVRILQLPSSFKGCAVELARSETELSANNAAFQGQKEVFRLLENDGKFTYLIANLGPKDAATAFFKRKIKPVNKTAKLVLYTEGGKEYLPE